MDSKTFLKIKTTVQTLSVLLSTFINSFLIFLIITKSSKKMGNYRHLMIYFCCCSIFFSSMDIIVQPVIHSHRSAFFMIMDLRSRGIPFEMAVIMICESLMSGEDEALCSGAMAGCFGVIIYGIAIHFIYRYFALQRFHSTFPFYAFGIFREGRVRYFDKKYLPIWFLIPLVGGIAWTLVSFFLFPMTPVTSEYIR